MYWSALGRTHNWRHSFGMRSLSLLAALGRLAGAVALTLVRSVGDTSQRYGLTLPVNTAIIPTWSHQGRPAPRPCRGVNGLGSPPLVFVGAPLPSRPLLCPPMFLLRLLDSSTEADSCSRVRGCGLEGMGLG